MNHLESRQLEGWAQKLMALLVVMVWAACFVVIKASLGEAPPLFSAALRGLVAGIPLLFAAAILCRLSPPRDTWGWLALLGLSNVTLGLGAMYLSVGQAGAVIPSVLANTQALLVAPFAICFFGETLTRGKLTALLLGFGGVILTVLPSGRALGSVEGALLALLASAGIASGTLILKKTGPQVDFITATSWQYLLGTFPLFAAAMLTEEIQRTTWNPAFLAGLLFLGLVGSAGASLIWFLLVQRVELIRLSSFTFLTPVFGLLFATLLFQKSLALINWVGLGLTIAGVAWLQHCEADGATAKRGALLLVR